MILNLCASMTVATAQAALFRCIDVGEWNIMF